MVIIPNVYNARSDIETGTVDINSFVVDIARESKTTCINGQSLEQTLQLLRTSTHAGDIVIVMGAGDVTKLADQLLLGR